jgi:lysozyme
MPQRKLSDAGAILIKSFESCGKREGDVFKPYVCPGGVLTIGWGHTNHHGRQFDKDDRWTQKECDAAFDQDMGFFERQVEALVKVSLKQCQFDALVSFAYNVGVGNLKSSMLLRKLNAGDYDSAALEFHRWNRSKGKVLPGLVRRRAAEALLFQRIPDLDFAGNPDPMSQSVGVR